LPNEIEERLSAFGGRRDVVMNEIRLPPAVPAWMADRAKLWNAVEAAEKRKMPGWPRSWNSRYRENCSNRSGLSPARAVADAYAFYRTGPGFMVDHR
jgi:hypothetical protein